MSDQEKFLQMQLDALNAKNKVKAAFVDVMRFVMADCNFTLTEVHSLKKELTSFLEAANEFIAAETKILKRGAFGDDFKSDGPRPVDMERPKLYRDGLTGWHETTPETK